MVAVGRTFPTTNPTKCRRGHPLAPLAEVKAPGFGRIFEEERLKPGVGPFFLTEVSTAVEREERRGPLHYEGWGKPSQRGSGVVRPLDSVNRKGTVGHRWAGKPARKPAPISTLSPRGGRS